MRAGAPMLRIAAALLLTRAYAADIPATDSRRLWFTKESPPLPPPPPPPLPPQSPSPPPSPPELNSLANFFEGREVEVLDANLDKFLDPSWFDTLYQFTCASVTILLLVVIALFSLQIAWCCATAVAGRIIAAQFGYPSELPGLYEITEEEPEEAPAKDEPRRKSARSGGNMLTLENTAEMMHDVVGDAAAATKKFTMDTYENLSQRDMEETGQGAVGLAMGAAAATVGAATSVCTAAAVVVAGEMGVELAGSSSTTTPSKSGSASGSRPNASLTDLV